MSGTPISAISSRSSETWNGNVREISGRRIITTSRLPWYDSLTARAQELVRLPKNWNGYGAPPVSLHICNFALSLLSSACSHSMSEPQLVPGENGDLQIEWHSLEYDIELHVRDVLDVVAVRHRGDDVDEVHLTNDVTIVALWLDEMEGAIAARRAAA